MAQIVSVASGKGGVGKSVVAANLAVLLTANGRRVVLADLDIGGANSHLLFGLLNPAVTLTDFLTRRVERLEDVAQALPNHANLRLIPGTGETLATANPSYSAKQRLIRHFQALEADLIIVDIGSGTGYHALDFYLMADHHLVVTTPDPTSVLDLYRFIKLAAIRRVLSAVLARGALATDLVNRDFSSVEEVLDAAGKTDVAGRWMAEAALRTFQPTLIVNRVSGRSRVNVLQLRALLKKYVGGDLTMLGEIPDDSAMERAVRAYLPIIDHEPASPAALALIQVAEALLPLLTHSVPSGVAGSQPVRRARRRSAWT